MKDGPQRWVGVARRGEVIPHRHHHVDVGIQRHPGQQRRKTPLFFSGVLREQLLELIDEQDGAAETVAPACDRLDDDIGVAGVGHHRLQGQCVARQLGSQCTAERGKC
jgi:hypothetical protein